MSVQFNVAIRVAAPGVTGRIIASAPFDIRRDRLPPRTTTPKYFFFFFIKVGINLCSFATPHSQEQGSHDQAEEGG